VAAATRRQSVDIIDTNTFKGQKNEFGRVPESNGAR
jgi:hypothetical protein